MWPAHAAHLREGLTPWLTGAGARSAEGTDIGHENGEAMAYVGVRVEPPVRLGSVGTVLKLHFEPVFFAWDALAETVRNFCNSGPNENPDWGSQ